MSESDPAEADRRPKLAIAVGLGWGIRNYLLSETFTILREHFDLLLISPCVAIPEFRRHFERPGVQLYQPRSQPEPWLARKLFSLAEMAYCSRMRTASRKTKLQDRQGLVGSWPVRSALQLFGSALFPPLHWLYRKALTFRWPPYAELRALLRRERVCGLFSTNLCEMAEWPAVLAARAEGLPVVAAVTSWDNPSTKRFRICDYDGYLAWSPAMVEHLQAHMEVRDTASIHVAGAPQFDFYHMPEYHQSRADFCRLHNLDPNRKIVVYSTVTPTIMPDEPDVLRAVHDRLRRGELQGMPQLLVRLHPKDRLERYEILRTDPERRDIAWTLAGNPKVATKDQWCPDRDDIIRGVNTVRHGDVNVHCRYSTMMIDFAALDKPVVVIAYDSQGSTAQARAYEQWEHLQPVVQSGAIRIAYTSEEMSHYLYRALAAPEEGHDARARLTYYELGDVDGQAGQRVAQAVMKIVLRANLRPQLIATTSAAEDRVRAA